MQSIWRHIQVEGLAKRYGNDFVFAHKIRHLFALAFLEDHEIPEAFELIKNRVLPDEAEGLAQWFRKYYVSGTHAKKSVSGTKLILKQNQPLFPPRMWSVSDRSYSIPKTQNALES